MHYKSAIAQNYMIFDKTGVAMYVYKLPAMYKIQAFYRLMSRQLIECLTFLGKNFFILKYTLSYA